MRRTMRQALVEWVEAVTVVDRTVPVPGLGDVLVAELGSGSADPRWGSASF